MFCLPRIGLHKSPRDSAIVRCHVDCSTDVCIACISISMGVHTFEEFQQHTTILHVIQKPQAFLRTHLLGHPQTPTERAGTVSNPTFLSSLVYDPVAKLLISTYISILFE